MTETQLHNLNDFEVARQRIRLVMEADKDTSVKQHKQIILEVTVDQAKTIKEATGLDLQGYKHTIEKSSVNHALNRHSDTNVEKNRGNQSLISPEDLMLLPDVLTYPDKISYEGKNKLGLDGIRYEKKFNDKIVVFEEVRTGRKELAFSTMYSVKTKKSEQVLTTLARTSETLSFLPTKVAKEIETTKSFAEKMADLTKKNTEALRKSSNNSQQHSKGM